MTAGSRPRPTRTTSPCATRWRGGRSRGRHVHASPGQHDEPLSRRQVLARENRRDRLARRDLGVRPARSAPSRPKRRGRPYPHRGWARGRAPGMSIAQALADTPSERSRPEESDAPMTSAPPLVHKPILWTRTAINPSKPRRTTTRRLAGSIAKLPANGRVPAEQANRFTRERSVVRNHPCPWEIREPLGGRSSHCCPTSAR